MRYWVYLPYVNPADGVYDWALPDAEVKAAIDAGLDVYLSLMWAPAHASGGVPAYEPFECATMSVGPDGSLRPAFNEKKPYCVDPPRLNTAWMRLVTQVVVSHFAELGVRYFGIWNEPNYREMYPPRMMGQLDYGRYITEVVRPFIESVHFVTEGRGPSKPVLLVVGPECDDVSTTAEILLREKASGQRWFDVISFHAYAWSEAFPEDAIMRAKEFLVAIDPYRDGREAWITEVGGNPQRSTEQGLAQQSAEITSYITSAESSLGGRVQRIFLYRILRNSGSLADHGLLLSDGAPSPAVLAIRKQLTGGEEEMPLIAKALSREELIATEPTLQKGDVVFWDEGSGQDVDFVIVRPEPGQQIPTKLTRLRVIE